MSDPIEPENTEQPKKKRKKKFMVAEVPIFTEICDFCEASWGSNVKFYDIQSKGNRKKMRGCAFCVFAMTLGLEGQMPPIFGARSQAEVAAAHVLQGVIDLSNSEPIPPKEEAPPTLPTPPSDPLPPT